ncbi:delta-type opioid receptor-like [Lytechinus pictus]|uniref:delta-type opioid receptor-like n=1 Tax=Lytechinus pictus TaxID=7653 RepID=UPI0030BA03A8
MTVLTFIFNLFALVVLQRWRHEFDEVSRMLFFNLALMNLISGVTTGIFDGMIRYLDRGEVSERLCHFLPFIGTYTLFSSMYEVALMNLQRYLAICYPFRYIRFSTVKRLIALFAILDFILISLSIPMLPIPSFPFYEFVTSRCGHETFTDGIGGATLGTNIYIYFAVYGFLYIIPFMILTYCNVRLFIIARRVGLQKCVIPVQPEEARKTDSGIPGLKGLRTVLIITCLFYMSIVPTFVFASVLVMPAFYLSRTGYDALYFLANAFLICSCWWNVPVYMSTSAHLRRRAIELYQRLKCCKEAR